MQPVSPPVSIVVTELNEIQEIERAVTSLMAQQPPAAELIVVDGGSTDGTWEWLDRAQNSNPEFANPEFANPELANSGPATRLIAIRDETCSLKFSKGPVSRGRNVAIAAASSSIVACADAGCTYAPDWLRNLTAPLAAGQAEYALGGSCLDPQAFTAWDVASAPFFSIKLAPNEPTKSCTARSMAFTKALWQRIGGFPEQVLVGEDTLFDLEARRLTAPAFISNAKALYRPGNSFRSAAHQMARYAISDGQAGVRWARLFRNAARCLLQLAALVFLFWTRKWTWIWTWVPFAAVLALECWYAFHRDLRFLPRYGAKAILARFVFSVAVPWIVAVNQIRGRFSSRPLTNWQNAGN